MLRSRTVPIIHELAIQGQSIGAIARRLALSRNTVRKYLRGAPDAEPRRQRATKLEPFMAQIQQWVEDDHLDNCVTMLERLKPLGYTGGITQVKAFVHPLRPRSVTRRPVRRYETAPGEQLQFDWGEFRYEEAGVEHKVFGFVAILSYSRLRFVTFTKRTDAPTLIRSLMATFEYCGGLPRAVLTDRMKSVLLEMEDRTPKWHPLFADFVASLGIAPRVCKPDVPQTKGKVERRVGVVKSAFWPGVRFVDLDDLNRQARAWCDRLNQRPHGTTHQPPVERWVQEPLAPLPGEWAWERFGVEERKVSWEGYFSYDGVLYGLPSEPPLAGAHVQVRERGGQLTVWPQGQPIVTLAKHGRSRALVPHPDQFRTVPSAAAARRIAAPLGHLIPTPDVASRPLAEYDRLCGVLSLAAEVPA
jgi:transposase